MPFLKENDEDYRPILTPLIDVVFLLIIFFLVSTEFIDLSRKVRIERPQSVASEESERVMKNVLELGPEGRLFLNGAELSAAGLPEGLRNIDPEKPLALRADKNAPYGTVMEILGICQRMGFGEIDAAVVDPEKTTVPH